MRTTLLCICLILFASVGTRAKEWRGIIPLHSSKQDVRRLLGPPKTQGKYVDSYELNDAFVDVYYASGSPCGSSLVNSWRVSRDTVVSIRITHRNTVPLQSLVSDIRGLKVSEDIKLSQLSYYSSDEEGVRYTIRRDNPTSMLDVMNVDYLPSMTDHRLKCSSATSTNQGVPPFQSYGNISALRRTAILDNFAIQLQNEKQLTGMVLVYSQDYRRASRTAQRIRNYLINVRALEPNRLVVKAAKRAGDPWVELYLLPTDRKGSDVAPRD
jgi:hypothetical protein